MIFGVDNGEEGDSWVATAVVVGNGKGDSVPVKKKEKKTQYIHRYVLMGVLTRQRWNSNDKSRSGTGGEIPRKKIKTEMMMKLRNKRYEK